MVADVRAPSSKDKSLNTKMVTYLTSKAYTAVQ